AFTWILSITNVLLPGLAMDRFVTSTKGVVIDMKDGDTDGLLVIYILLFPSLFRDKTTGGIPKSPI
ncbi:MAG: hypothetical protein QXU86_07540, partial [Metallosphaera sp.]